jgi:ribonuclease BN (tRNA processing enzyme)
MSIRRDDAGKTAEESRPDSLRIRWLGTNSYLIAMGDASVLVDPFVSHHGIVSSFLGDTLETDRALLEDVFGDVALPDAIFIAHSHWDHLMDVAALHDLWEEPDIPIYGSETTRNILSGYRTGIDSNWRQMPIDRWYEIPHPGKTRLEILVVESSHAPHADTGTSDLDPVSARARAEEAPLARLTSPTRRQPPRPPPRCQYLWRGSSPREGGSALPVRQGASFVDS